MSASDRDRDRDVGRRASSVSGRVRHAWHEMPGERRLAAVACIGLFLSLFLPWYQLTVIARGVTSLRSLSASSTGWGAFSFVEAAVLLVASGVLTLLFMRGEGHAFHVPGGDGGVVTAAGGWTCVLLIWRMFDKQGTTGYGQYAETTGIEWGIFVALIIAGVLTYAGTRIRLAHEPEPPLPGEQYLGPDAAERRDRRLWRRRSRAGSAGGRGPASAEAREPRTERDRPQRPRESEAQRRPRDVMDVDVSWTAQDEQPTRRERADPGARPARAEDTVVRRGRPDDTLAARDPDEEIGIRRARPRRAADPDAEPLLRRIDDAGSEAPTRLDEAN
jgi:hypothetical protein